MGVVSKAAAWGEYWQWLHVHGGPRKAHLRPETLADYHATIWQFWGSLPANRSWHKATPGRDLAHFLDRRITSGPNTGKPVSHATRSHDSRVIAAFYLHAARKRWGPRLAVWADYRPEPKPQDRVRSLDLANVAMALRTITDPRDRVMVALAYYAALRAGEIARLKVEDCDLRGSGPSLRVDGKGGIERDMPIRPPLAAILRPYIWSRPPTGPLLENRHTPHRHLTDKAVSEFGSRALHSAGIDATLHQLRHTHAVELCEATGYNVYSVKEALGHASITSTEIYIRGLRVRALGPILDQLPDPLAPRAPKAATGDA